MEHVSVAGKHRGNALVAVLLASCFAGAAGTAQAQQSTAAPPPNLPWPAPAQAAAPQAAPAPQGARRASPDAPTAPRAGQQGSSGPAKAGKRRAAAKASAAPSDANAIRCEGPWAKDATHEKLAEALGAENVVFTEVDGPEGTKLNASVVFPKDPKRRVEVLWHDEAGRARPSSIIVSGESTWTAPRPIRIGTALAEVEKQNGKPFKLSGFDWDYGGTAGDWQGGALSKLGGGCVLGMRFEPDASAPAAARSKVSGDTEFLSNNPAMKAAKPKVSEFFLGYPE